MPTIDFDDEERAAVIAALREKLDRERYPRAPRLDPLRSALAKLVPARAVAPRPAPSKPLEPPSRGRYKRR